MYRPYLKTVRQCDQPETHGKNRLTLADAAELADQDGLQVEAAGLDPPVWTPTIIGRSLHSWLVL
jgi:hypothetical protein